MNIGNICITGMLENLNYLAGIFVAFTGGICALKGIDYLKSLRQKKMDATFSFEIQLYVRLQELYLLLDQNEFLLTYLYSQEARKEWSDARGAPEDVAQKFYTCAEETLNFIKTVPDQMPVNRGWLTDYAKLLHFLLDVVHFDIRCPERSFKYTEKCEQRHREEQWQKACSALNSLLEKIKEDQEIAETIMYDNCSA